MRRLALVCLFFLVFCGVSFSRSEAVRVSELKNQDWYKQLGQTPRQQVDEFLAEQKKDTVYVRTVMKDGEIAEILLGNTDDNIVKISGVSREKNEHIKCEACFGDRFFGTITNKKCKTYSGPAEIVKYMAEDVDIQMAQYDTTEVRCDTEDTRVRIQIIRKK